MKKEFKNDVVKIGNGRQYRSIIVKAETTDVRGLFTTISKDSSADKYKLKMQCIECKC